MPKSKRNKVVPLTKTKKKGTTLKEGLVEEVRSCCDAYERIFVINVENMRNTKMKEVRNLWMGSRFFFGKNKVMIHALGKAPEDEHKNNLHHLTKRITGACGLLFTNTKREEVLKFFDEFSEPNFARSGCIATETISIKKGPMTQPFSMEVHLRNLGLKTKLDDGVIQLLADTTVCTKGDTLTPEQCRLLEIFEIQMAEFKILVDCVWDSGEFEQLIEVVEGDEGDEEEDVEVEMKDGQF